MRILIEMDELQFLLKVHLMVNDFIHNDQVKKIFLLFGFQYLQSEQCFLFFWIRKGLEAEITGS